MDLVDVALRFFGTRYDWGGNKPDEGFDCSGFVLEVMRSVGLHDNRDFTSQQLYSLLSREYVSTEPQRNAILFFGKNPVNITHVAIAIDSKLMLEAGGEGKVSTNKGYVRIRPISNRKDFIGGFVL